MVNIREIHKNKICDNVLLLLLITYANTVPEATATALPPELPPVMNQSPSSTGLLLPSVLLGEDT